jgi:hypothetical protein
MSKNVLILIALSWEEVVKNLCLVGRIDLATEVSKRYGETKVSAEILSPGKKSLSATARLNRQNLLRRLRDGEFDGVIIAGDNNHHFIREVLDAVKASKTTLVNKATEGSELDDCLQGFIRLAGGGIRV